MTVTGPDSAMLLKDMGLSRVVAARELSLKELSAIYERTGMELEAFIHGAICYCYSGQCLFSGVIGGRSGNRGRCAQPCRLPYSLKREGGSFYSDKKNPYLLSLKDMNTLAYLPALVKAGVMSFKIEGRMKSPLYTAGIVSIYRKYMDLYLAEGEKGYRVSSKDNEALSEFFDRGGFTDYMERHNGKEMIALKEKPKTRIPDQALMKATEEKYLNKDLKKPVDQVISLVTGAPMSFTVSAGNVTVGALSEMDVTPALKKPLTQADVNKQMAKLGNTPFCVASQDTFVSDDAFLPVQGMNALRREVMEKLKEDILASYKREKTDRVYEEAKTDKEPSSVTAAVSLLNTEGLSEVLACDVVADLYLDSAGIAFSALFGLTERVHAAGKKLYLTMARIVRKEASLEWEKEADGIYKSGLDGIIVTCLDGLGLLAKTHCPLPVIIDHSLYTFNREADAFMRRECERLGLKLLRTTAPLELNESELKARNLSGSELVVYGAIPMMVSANCLRKTTAGCNRKNERLMLTDRKGISFPVCLNCKYCYNVIYNSVPTYLLDRADILPKLSPSSVRVSFTTESKKEREAVLSALTSFMKNKAQAAVGQITRGHFKKGVI